MTVRQQREVKQQAWIAYVVRFGGLWRWLRGPLIWPTPSPAIHPAVSATATGLPEPTATPTVWPAPALAPLPSDTLYPTPVPSPTAYTAMAPGQQAVVVAGVAALRLGPGEHYGTSLGLTLGTVVTVLEWPRWVDSVPWYRVQLSEISLLGWCQGLFLAPLSATITPTPTSAITAGPATGIAFTSDRDGNGEVYVMQADGTRVQNLSRHPAQDRDPSWAPLRDRLAFASDRSGNSDVFVMNADGTGVTQLTFSPSDQMHPAWSPSSAFIAYVSNEDGDWEIWLMSASGSGAVQLTENDAWDSYPAWSPDGRFVAYTSERDGNYELYQYDLFTHSETRLTNHPASDAFPAWSPNGA